MVSLFDDEQIMKTYVEDIEKETERMIKRENDIGGKCR